MTSALRIYGGNAFSYHTMIKQRVSGSSVTIGNITDYRALGKTTARHQRLACVHSCDILLDDVPINCADLLQLAYERKLITVARIGEGKIAFSFTPREEE